MGVRSSNAKIHRPNDDGRQRLSPERGPRPAISRPIATHLDRFRCQHRAACTSYPQHRGCVRENADAIAIECVSHPIMVEPTVMVPQDRDDPRGRSQPLQFRRDRFRSDNVSTAHALHDQLAQYAHQVGLRGVHLTQKNDRLYVLAMANPRTLATAALALALTVTSATSSAAAIITFSDRATFLAVTGASDATGALPNLGVRDDNVVAGTSSATVGSATYTAVRWFMGAAGFPAVVGLDWTTLLPGHDIAITQGVAGPDDSLDISFASPVFSAGFDFSESGLDGFVQNGCYVSCVDSTFEVTLRNGAASIGSFLFNAPNDVAAFVGVWSAASFTKLEVRELVGSDDNEYYGRVYTGARPALDVPEASTLALFVFGLVGVAVRGLRRA